MINPIDIVCYYDQNHQVLYDYFFYPSYQQYVNQDHFVLKPTVVKTKGTDCSYLSQHWSNMLIQRYDILLSYIKKNTDRWTIFTDVDVVFLNDISDSINKLVQNNNGAEIFYMKEAPYMSRNKEVNGGFFIFKCTDIIVNFFRHIQNCTKQMDNPNDQVCINKLLLDLSIPFALLPPIEYLTNNGRMDTTKRNILNNKTKVLHATSTYNLNTKIQILSSALILKERSNNKLKGNAW